MTVTEALMALHRAGRIRRPFLVGMSLSGRLVVEACETGSYVYLLGPRHSDRPEHWDTNAIARMELQPDADPATTGCLLAQLREAEKDPGATTSPPTDMDGNWYVHLPIEDSWATDFGSPTEGEAISAAIVALAAQVSP